MQFELVEKSLLQKLFTVIVHHYCLKKKQSTIIYIQHITSALDIYSIFHLATWVLASSILNRLDLLFPLLLDLERCTHDRLEKA